MTEAEAIDYLRTYYVGAKSKHRAAIEIVLSALDQAQAELAATKGRIAFLLRGPAIGGPGGTENCIERTTCDLPQPTN